MSHLNGSILRKRDLLTLTLTHFYIVLVVNHIENKYLFVSLAIRSIYIYLPEELMSVCDEAAPFLGVSEILPLTESTGLALFAVSFLC